MVRTPKDYGRVTALIGGQYGSEGKGKFAAYLANEYDVHVRSGGPNAGHSLDYDDEWWKMQQVPCGWINPDATLVLTRGALIDIHQLHHELYTTSLKLDTVSRMLVDANAMVIDQRHRNVEGGVHGEIHQRIGSTGEGVGAARVARMNRQIGEIYRFYEFLDKGMADSKEMTAMLNATIYFDTEQFLNASVEVGQNVLLEGTQGQGLSLIHGPWPYVTSADTGASALLSDAGLSPRLLTDVVMVIRTFPIRVAGNSGPLSHEITWQELSERLGKEVEERTTVTKKVRRIGRWDEDLVEKAVRINRPDSFALSFVDYLNPNDAGKLRLEDLSIETRAFIDYLETYFNVPVTLISTGPMTAEMIDLR